MLISRRCHIAAARCWRRFLRRLFHYAFRLLRQRAFRYAYAMPPLPMLAADAFAAVISAAIIYAMMPPCRRHCRHGYFHISLWPRAATPRRFHYFCRRLYADALIYDIVDDCRLSVSSPPFVGMAERHAAA